MPEEGGCRVPPFLSIAPSLLCFSFEEDSCQHHPVTPYLTIIRIWVARVTGRERGRFGECVCVGEGGQREREREREWKKKKEKRKKKEIWGDW